MSESQNDYKLPAESNYASAPAKGYVELHVGQVGVGGLLRLSRTP
jgi:hypothetical protein